MRTTVATKTPTNKEFSHPNRHKVITWTFHLQHFPLLALTTVQQKSLRNMSLILSCLRSKASLAQRTVLPSVAAYSSSPVLSTKKETVTTMDVVRNVAETHDLSVAESRRILDTVFDTITDVSWTRERERFCTADYLTFYCIAISFSFLLPTNCFYSPGHGERQARYYFQIWIIHFTY